jgi:hypothetical protein
MSTRSDRLSKHLILVEQGKKKVEKVSDAKLLLEALCDQPGHLRCIEKLVSSQNTLDALQNSFRVDLSSGFVNGSASEFLTYLQDPSIESFCNGQFVRKIVSCIAYPPTFWNVFLEAHDQKGLTEQAELGFAWLLLNLLSSPTCSDDIVQIAKENALNRSFLDSSSHRIRTIGYRIDNILKTTSATLIDADGYRPGGRHDNDFENFREIMILPTPDEIASNDLPFYRRADEIYNVTADHRPAMHYDNQFRLLREDLLAELRNDLQVARGQKKGRRSPCRIDGLALWGVNCGDPNRQRPQKQCCLAFKCNSGLPQLSRLSKTERKKKIDEDRNLLKHQALGCLLNGTDVVAFATVDRNESSLHDDVPTLVLDITGQDGLNRILTCASTGTTLTFIVVNTAVFAYEPILQRLQGMTEFPMSDCLLSSEPSQQALSLTERLSTVVGQIKATEGKQLGYILGTKREIALDSSQLRSLLAGLEQSVSIIQGPPGTGKSFIGALLAKTLHDFTDHTLMVLCYTNHALDQFLEDLMDIGIPDSSMVRLGSKATPRTKALGLYEQSMGTGSGSLSWSFIHERRQELDKLDKELKSRMKEFKGASANKSEMLEYLEFSCDSDFYEAFVLPEEESGMQPVGRRGMKIGKHYLWDRWVKGQDAGAFQGRVNPDHVRIWKMPTLSRQELFVKWQQEISSESRARIVGLIEKYNSIKKELDEYFYHKKNSEILQKKRVIACTTTAAAKYNRALQAAKPGVILVEEAGEILESHVLTAMTSDTQQLVLIGDHKQLRPKISNYNLSVEKGDGYDLNRSLFERLIIRGFPHTSLSKQHRMRPEISRLVRSLTYPDLQDAEGTRNRPALRGFQNDVVFVNHGHLETDLQNVKEKRDPTATCSKQNLFEVQMILMVVRYLGQQGYGTDDIIILTPYLGQLSLLRRELSKTNDPILNDLDSNDLVNAGLLDPGSAKLTRQPIRISTIDNYQGEECNIVVATLTRSKASADIGFMAAAERVNVLLSRARNSLIMIGNADTFRGSRKGRPTWQPLFDLLREHGHVYDGFPLKCERHPDRKVAIREPKEFQTECPDGGCLDPCSSPLPCGIHNCALRCHRLDDHSKMKCTKIMENVCPKSHKYYWKCYEGTPKICPVCLEEAIESEKRRAKDLELEAKRQAIQREHARKLLEIEKNIEEERQKLNDIEDEKERRNVLAQKAKDLEKLKAAPVRQPPLDPRPRKAADGTPKSSNSGSISVPSVARDEWEQQKRIEGQSN